MGQNDRILKKRLFCQISAFLQNFYKKIKKFTIVVDESLIGIGVRATMGINRDPKQKEQIHKALLKTPEIVMMSEVTGRFDMLLTVRAKNLEELHSVAIEKIGKIEGIQNTETFVELQRTEKDQSYELKE